MFFQLSDCGPWTRLQKQGLEWGEQRARFKEITRTMESKFAQLVKLKRVRGREGVRSPHTVQERSADSAIRKALATICAIVAVAQ